MKQNRQSVKLIIDQFFKQRSRKKLFTEPQPYNSLYKNNQFSDGPHSGKNCHFSFLIMKKANSPTKICMKIAKISKIIIFTMITDQSLVNREPLKISFDEVLWIHNIEEICLVQGGKPNFAGCVFL